MKRLTGWLGRATSYVLYYGPPGLRRALGLTLAFLWFDVLRIRRQVAIDNVGIAFPELPMRERVRIARGSLRQMGMSFAEYSFMPFMNRAEVEKHFDFRGLDLVDEVLARGKGVLVLTLHLGNGDLCCSAMSALGYPMVMVSKFFKAKWLNDLWFGMRERVGTKFVGPRNSSYALLKALKSKQIVVIPLDQFTGPPIGVRTTFFGRETGTAAGLAVMAQRSGAPVIASYCRRLPDGRNQTNFVREVPIEGLSAEAATQKFNDELESFVRLYPDQWMWIHKRWKTFKV